MSGFQLIRNQTNAEYPGPPETYAYNVAQTSALAVGDLVMAGSDGSTSGIQNVERVTIKTDSSAGQTTTSLIGVVVGNDIDPDNEVVGIPLNHATDRKVYVSTGQYNIYEVEVSGTSIVAANVGLNVSVIATASIVGSISTSNFVIDGTTNTPSTSGIFPFRLVGINTKIIIRI